MTNDTELRKMNIMLCTSQSLGGKGIPRDLEFLVDGKIKVAQNDNGKWNVTDAGKTVTLARDLPHLEDALLFIVGARFMLADA